MGNEKSRPLRQDKQSRCGGTDESLDNEINIWYKRKIARKKQNHGTWIKRNRKSSEIRNVSVELKTNNGKNNLVVSSSNGPCTLTVSSNSNEATGLESGSQEIETHIQLNHASEGPIVALRNNTFSDETNVKVRQNSSETSYRKRENGDDSAKGRDLLDHADITNSKLQRMFFDHGEAEQKKYTQEDSTQVNHRSRGRVVALSAPKALNLSNIDKEGIPKKQVKEENLSKYPFSDEHSNGSYKMETRPKILDNERKFPGEMDEDHLEEEKCKADSSLRVPSYTFMKQTECLKKDKYSSQKMDSNCHAAPVDSDDEEIEAMEQEILMLIEAESKVLKAKYKIELWQKLNRKRREVNALKTELKNYQSIPKLPSSNIYQGNYNIPRQDESLEKVSSKPFGNPIIPEDNTALKQVQDLNSSLPFLEQHKRLTNIRLQKLSNDKMKQSLHMEETPQPTSNCKTETQCTVYDSPYLCTKETGDFTQNPVITLQSLDGNCEDSGTSVQTQHSAVLPNQETFADISKALGCTESVSETKQSATTHQTGDENKFSVVVWLSKHPDYQNVDKRIDSFRRWAEHLHQTPREMAEAGFFYQDDDPILEHTRWSPCCEYVVRLKGDRYVAAVQIWHQEKITEHQRMETKLAKSYHGLSMIDQTSQTEVPTASEALQGGQVAALGASPQLQFEGESSGCPDAGTRTDDSITVVYQAKHPDYLNVSKRVISFHGWPDYLDQTPRQMAEAGFFYVGVADFTRCFFCGKGLRNWKPGDDPMVEHTRWNPRCDYVVKMKGEIYVAAVQRLHNTHIDFERSIPSLCERSRTPIPDYIKLIVEQHRQKIEFAQTKNENHDPPDSLEIEAAAVMRELGDFEERTRDAVFAIKQQTGPGSSSKTTEDLAREETSVRESNKDSKKISTNSPGCSLSSRLKHPQFNNMAQRIGSYKGWPDGLNQTPSLMSVAGFFYVGKADCTKCFCCGGGLKNWSPGDNPVVEHAVWFPDCEYINRLKGEVYVSAVEEQRQKHETPNESNECGGPPEIDYHNTSKEHVSKPIQKGYRKKRRKRRKSQNTGGAQASVDTSENSVSGDKARSRDGNHFPKTTFRRRQKLYLNPNRKYGKTSVDSEGIPNNTSLRGIYSTDDYSEDSGISSMIPTQHLYDKNTAMRNTENEKEQSCLKWQNLKKDVTWVLQEDDKELESIPHQPTGDLEGIHHSLPELQRASTQRSHGCVGNPFSSIIAPSDRNNGSSRRFESFSWIQALGHTVEFDDEDLEMELEFRQRREELTDFDLDDLGVRPPPNTPSPISGESPANSISTTTYTSEVQQTDTTTRLQTVAHTSQQTDTHTTQQTGIHTTQQRGNNDVTDDNLRTSRRRSSESASDSKYLKAENVKLREIQTCTICMEQPVNTTFLPCGHLVCCEDCAAQLARCPICRKRIEGTVKTFMS